MMKKNDGLNMEDRNMNRAWGREANLALLLLLDREAEEPKEGGKRRNVCTALYQDPGCALYSGGGRCEVVRVAGGSVGLHNLCCGRW